MPNVIYTTFLKMNLVNEAAIACINYEDGVFRLFNFNLKKSRSIKYAGGKNLRLTILV